MIIKKIILIVCFIVYLHKGTPDRKYLTKLASVMLLGNSFIYFFANSIALPTSASIFLLLLFGIDFLVYLFCFCCFLKNGRKKEKYIKSILNEGIYICVYV